MICVTFPVNFAIRNVAGLLGSITVIITPYSKKLFYKETGKGKALHFKHL